MNNFNFVGCHVIYDNVYCGFASETKLVCQGDAKSFANFELPQKREFLHNEFGDVQVQLTMHSDKILEFLLESEQLKEPTQAIDVGISAKELTIVAVDFSTAWSFSKATLNFSFSHQPTSKSSELVVVFTVWTATANVLAKRVATNNYISKIPTYENLNVTQIEELVISYLDSKINLVEPSCFLLGWMPEHIGVQVKLLKEQKSNHFEQRSLTIELKIRHSLYTMAQTLYDSVLATLPTYPNTQLVGIELQQAIPPNWERPWFLATVTLNMIVKK